MRARPAFLFAAAATALTISTAMVGCTGPLPEPDRLPGSPRGALAPCTQWPNCVSSDASEAAQAIAPFRPIMPRDQAWPIIRAALASLPGTTVVLDDGAYLKAESRSPTFAFTDDVELFWREGRDTIAIRSASRVGLNDLGVNRRRIEALRDMLARQGVIR